MHRMSTELKTLVDLLVIFPCEDTVDLLLKTQR